MSQGLNSSLLHNPLRKTTLCLLLLLCPRHLLPKTHVVTHHVLMTSKWESSTLASQTRLTRERLQRHPDHQLCLYLSLYQRRCRTKGLPTYVTLCTSVMKRIAVSLINHHNSRLVRLRASHRHFEYRGTSVGTTLECDELMPWILPERDIKTVYHETSQHHQPPISMRKNLTVCSPAPATLALKKTFTSTFLKSMVQ